MLADKADRRRVISAFQAIQMMCPVIIIILLMAHLIEPWMVVSLSLIVGVTDALSMPSFQTIAPSIVRRDQIPTAIALNATQFNLSRILGPTLAGVLMASVGAIGCFAANALSYLPFISVALWILPTGVPAARSDQGLDRRRLFIGLAGSLLPKK
jgi:MFS family permease